jgi:hypothetical protein
MPSLQEQEATLDLINTEIAGRLGRQAAAGSQVDTKAALLAGAAATATQFLASREGPRPVFAHLAYVAYAVAFLTAVGAYAVARYQDVPDPRGLMRQCVQLTEAETLARLAATRTKAFEANRSKHRRKVVLWWISVVVLSVGLALSTIAIVHTGTVTDPAPDVRAVPDPNQTVPGGDAFIEEYSTQALVSHEAKDAGRPDKTTVANPDGMERR